jgi:hypothetical protein
VPAEILERAIATRADTLAYAVLNARDLSLCSGSTAFGVLSALRLMGRSLLSPFSPLSLPIKFLFQFLALALGGVVLAVSSRAIERAVVFALPLVEFVGHAERNPTVAALDYGKGLYLGETHQSSFGTTCRSLMA